ncbi:MAG: alpha/beta hydrolase [Bdellovibrionota bacterium]
MEQASALFPVPSDVRRESVLAGGVPAEWVEAPGADPARVILYFHGGGYALGSLKTHRSLVAALSRQARSRVLSLGYRLAPEHPFPAAVEDACAAYGWLLEQGVGSRRVFLAGDSAGGGLTISALLAIRDAGTPLPAAGLCLCPWVDLLGTGRSLLRNASKDPMIEPEGLKLLGRLYLGEGKAVHPWADPLGTDLSGLPPLLIQAGTNEALLDDATRLADRARDFGVRVSLRRWKDMFHVWHFFAPILPEGKMALEEIGRFVERHAASPRRRSTRNSPSMEMALG